MARVTVEDCVVYVPNRFELVIMAARRARQLARGAETSLEEDVSGKKDKFTVMALREIGDGLVDTAGLLEPEIEEKKIPENDETVETAPVVVDKETSPTAESLFSAPDGVENVDDSAAAPEAAAPEVAAPEAAVLPADESKVE